MPLSDVDFDSLDKQIDDPLARVVIGLLRQSNQEQLKQIEALTTRIGELSAQVDELRQMLFGRKSEKLPTVASEVRRRLEPEELIRYLPATVDVSTPKARADALAALSKTERSSLRRRAGRARSEAARKEKRAARAKSLPVIIEQVMVSADQLPTGMTLEDFREVSSGAGTNEIVRIDHVREHLVQVCYQLQTLASRDGDHIITARTPPSVTEGSHYTAGVYADVVVSKCVDSQPFYRIEKRYERAGCPISRSTLCELFHRCAAILTPIHLALLDMARHAPIVNADETTVPVTQEGGCRDGWIWTLVTDTVIAYHFDSSRAGQVAKDLLAGTTGKLQVDGYSAYNAVCSSAGRLRIGCWAHARRLFFKAKKDFPEAERILEWIVDLYTVEHRARDAGIAGAAEHLAMRRETSAPLLKTIKAWLDEKQPLYPPKSKLGKAIGYAINQWESLEVFVDDAAIPLDNNVSERALRIIALGRKNWLFVGEDGGGESMAVLQTIVATCKLHGVNSYDYIRDVLLRIQQIETKDLTPLLPANWKTPR